MSFTPVAWLPWPVDGAETEACRLEAGCEASDQRGGSVQGLCPREGRSVKGNSLGRLEAQLRGREQGGGEAGRRGAAELERG